MIENIPQALNEETHHMMDDEPIQELIVGDVLLKNQPEELLKELYDKHKLTDKERWDLFEKGEVVREVLIDTGDKKVTEITWPDGERRLLYSLSSPEAARFRLTDEAVQKIKDNALNTQVGGGHYKQYAIQPIEFIHKNNVPYAEANVIKYVMRHKQKNGVEDLKKAIHYIQLLAEMEYGVKL